MLSIIICSTKPEMVARLAENIAHSVGAIQYEIVSIDNRAAEHSLCRAYNIGAQRAVGDMFLFLHQDVEFLSDGWGEILERRLSDESCGVVGLAGSTIKSSHLSGWAVGRDHSRSNIYEGVERRSAVRHKTNPLGEDFSHVVVLDGVFLAVRRDVFRAIGGFDEINFTKFHLYDLDVSIAAHIAGYRNEVCHSIDMMHFSKGSFDDVWVEQSEIFHKKWAAYLPQSIETIHAKKWKRISNRVRYNMAYLSCKKGFGAPAFRRALVRATLKSTPLRANNIELIMRYIKSNKK